MILYLKRIPLNKGHFWPTIKKEGVIRMKRTKNNKLKRIIKYPSAELLQPSCFEDYKRLIDTYDKIYEKINIALAFCSVVILLILNSFDYNLFFGIFYTKSKLELFSVFILLLCSTISVICMIWAVIELLLLTRSKSIIVFDSISIRNDEIYYWPKDQAALWLIEKYTYAVFELRKVISNKQKKYDSIVIKIVISILSYAIVLIIEKGV